MPSKQISVSVIVLNWNGKHFLGRCLGSLLDQSYPDYEILLVDNGSTDRSVEFVKESFGKNATLRIIALKENYGFCKGNNIGIKHANGDYIIILNNDTEVTESFITQLVRIAESNRQIGSVGCKILTKNRKIWFSQKFTNGGFIVPFFLQTLVENHIEAISGSFTANLANSGCAVLYRKSILDKLGSYDEDFWSNWEDWDLGYRINLAGCKSMHISEPLVFHVGGGSEGFSPERYTRIYRNMLFAYFKNYELKNIVIRFPVLLYILLPLYHIGWFLHRIIAKPPEFNRKKMIQYFFSIIRAYVQFLLNLSVFMKKRYNVQNLRTLSDKEIFARTQRKCIL